MIELDSLFRDATNRARRLTASRYALEACEPSSPDYPAERVVAGARRPWREVWRVALPASPGAPEDMELLVAIPGCFPDELPHIYLPLHQALRVGCIPHVDRRRFVCTFDPNEVSPNCDSHPGEIVVAAIERALALCIDGTAGLNAHEFQEEFDAYWVQGAQLEVLSLVEPDSCLREVVVASIKHFPAGSHLFAEKGRQARRWLDNLGRSAQTIEPALYLPLPDLGAPPYPETNGEIWSFLNDHSPEHAERLLDFLSSQKRPTPVLFSVPAQDGQGERRTLGAWWHPEFFHGVQRGPASFDKRGVIPGFAPGPAAVRREMSLIHANKKLMRARVTRVDVARLNERTKGTSAAMFDLPVNVIGCGSVGGFLAAALAREGVLRELRTVDLQRLGIENVPRHLCPTTRVGDFKARAVAAEVAAHFPHVRCEPHAGDVLSLLVDSPSIFKRSSLSIVALGDLAVERRLNRLAKADSETWSHPLCFAWVEPHLYGGHAVWLQPEQPGCLECAFDDGLLFSGRVLEQSQGYSRREAGCQTTFVPYGGADVTAFTSALSRFILESAAGASSRVFSWSGDLDRARCDGVVLRSDWQAAASFSTRVQPLVPNAECSACHAPLASVT